MVRVLALVGTMMLLLTACGGGDAGDGDGGGEFGDVGDCEALVDETIVMFQEVIDEIGGMSLEEMAALGTEPPAALEDMEARGEALDERATELGCSDEELEAGLEANLDQLEAEGPVGEMILQGIQEEGLGS